MNRVCTVCGGPRSDHGFLNGYPNKHDFGEPTRPDPGEDFAGLSAEDVLVGVDGNAFSVIAAVRQALRRAGASKEYRDAYLAEAMSGDYVYLLAVSVAYLEDEA